MSEQKYLELNPNNIQYEGYEKDKDRFITLNRIFEVNPSIEIPGMRQEFEILKAKISKIIKTVSPKVEILETKVKETELSTQEKALLEELTNLKNQRDDLEKKINLAEINPEDCYYAEINQDRLKLDELKQIIANHPISIKNKEILEKENLENREKIEQENLKIQYDELLEKIYFAEKNMSIYPGLKQDKMKLAEIDKKITDYREKIEKEQYTNLTNQINELKNKINLAELNPEDCYYAEINQDKLKLAELEKAEKESPCYVKIDEASLSAEEITLVTDFIEDFTSSFIITNKADYIKTCNFLNSFNANTIPNLTLSNEETIEVKGWLNTIITNNSLFRAFYAQDFAEKATMNILNANQNAELDTLYKLVDTISINNLKEIKVTEKELAGIKAKIKEEIKNKKNCQPNPLDTEKETQIANFINGFKNSLIINSQEDLNKAIKFSENLQENAIPSITLTPEELVSVKEKLLNNIVALPTVRKIIDDRVTPTKKELSKKFKNFSIKKWLIDRGFKAIWNPEKKKENKKEKKPTIKVKGYRLAKLNIFGFYNKSAELKFYDKPLFSSEEWVVENIAQKAKLETSKDEITTTKFPCEENQRLLTSMNLPMITVKILKEGGKVILKNVQTSEIKYAKNFEELKQLNELGFTLEALALTTNLEEELGRGLLENHYPIEIFGEAIQNVDEYSSYLQNNENKRQKNEETMQRLIQNSKKEVKEKNIFKRMFKNNQSMESYKKEMNEFFGEEDEEELGRGR